MKNLFRKLMLVQVILAVGGSLYFSNFGDPMLGLFAGTGFNPCHLCWRGRILMYPLLPVVVYALLSKDDRLSFLTAFSSFSGMFLAAYHYLIQQRALQNVFACAPGNDCSSVAWHIWFVTIPFLEFIAFVVIFVLSVIILLKLKKKK